MTTPHYQDAENATLPLPEYLQHREHDLCVDGKPAASKRFTGTLAGAQNEARILSRAHGAGVTIRSRGELVAYLNNASNQ